MGVNVDVAASADAHGIDAGDLPEDVRITPVMALKIDPPLTSRPEIFAEIIHTRFGRFSVLCGAPCGVAGGRGERTMVARLVALAYGGSALFARRVGRRLVGARRSSPALSNSYGNPISGSC